ncbi:MAG: transcriptional regulator, MarR family [Rhodocyclales bacterium]|nr:transcriptional regulator, MarR family [Rhodocyclales bacterium]
MLVDPQNWVMEDSLGYLLSRVRGYVMQALDDELADLDITAAQWVIIMKLSVESQSTAAGLCKQSGYDTGSMTRMLDRLEDKGLILRERSPDDRRVLKLALTESGLRLREQLPERAARVINAHLEGFSAEEFVLLKSLLRRMLDNALRLAPHDQADTSPSSAEVSK